MDPKDLPRINELLEELYRLVNGEPESEAPATSPTPISQAKDDEIELEGMIGRPEFKVVGKNRKLWTAGLGIKEGNLTRWHSLEAWGKVAEAARTIERGSMVRVVGKAKTDQYVGQDGVMKERHKFVVSLIRPVNDGVSSATTA